MKKFILKFVKKYPSITIVWGDGSSVLEKVLKEDICIVMDKLIEDADKN